MDYLTLKTEIESGPLAVECAGQGDIEIATILNNRRYQMVASRFVSARTILAELVDGAAILDKLSIAAASVSSVKWAMSYLSGETGIDIGHPGTIGQIDMLAYAGILTADDATALKRMAFVPASRAEIIGLGAVTAGDVSRALRGPY